jgi:hypothetical protein
MELTRNEAEFEHGPIAPQPVREGPLAALLEWQAMAEGAYSANTLRAQKADGAIFQAFCESRGEPYLPADLMTIRAFIEDRVKGGQEACHGEALCGNHRAGAYRGGFVESLLE